MKISINGFDYQTPPDSPIVPYLIDPLAVAIRDTGVQRRSDFTKYNRLVFNQWTRWGIGWPRMRRELGSAIGGMRDSDALTLYPEQITNGILHESQSHATPADHLKKYALFKGDFWALLEEDYKSGALEGLVCAKYGGTSDDWTEGFMPQFNAASTGSQGSGASLTVSHTVQGTYGNRLTVVIVFNANSGDPSGVTEAGNGMTMHASYTSGAFNFSIWYKAAPTTGAQDYVASGIGGDSAMVVMDFWHCPQTSPLRAMVSSSDTGTSSSLTPTSALGDFVIGAVRHAAGVTTPGAGQTEVMDVNTGGVIVSASYERGAGGAGGASTTTHSYSWSASETYNTIAAAIKGTGGISYTEANAEGIRGFDLGVHKGRMYALGSHGIEETAYMVWSTADGEDWRQDNGTDWPSTAYLTTTVTRRNNFDDDMGKLLPFGNTILSSIYEGPVSSGGSISQIRVIYSTDEGTNWTAGAVIPSGDGPKAFVRWKDPFSSPVADSPVLVTAEGVYRVDSGGTTFDLLHELDGDPNNGRWAAVGQDGGLYIGLGDGGVRVLYVTGPGLVEVRTSNRGNFVTARQGHVNCMLAPSIPWILVAYGGHAANKQASIFAIDYEWQQDPATGRLFQPWHSMYLEADANIDITTLGYSTEDDATPRLHFALEHASSSEMFHLEEPFTNPASGVIQKYQSSSFVEIAEDDLGDPHANGAVYAALLDAGDLSATDAGEYVEHEYGVNGAAWTDVSDLGYFVSGDKTLWFGRTNQNVTGQNEAGTSIGVEAQTFRARLVLTRDAADNTQTPKIREFELRAYKNVAIGLQGYGVEIDLKASAALLSAPIETVISRLETVMASNTLVTFAYGDSGTLYVRAVPSRLGSIFTDPDMTRPYGKRRGIMTLQLERIQE